MQGVERKGATMPYTSVNGNMFSFLDKEGNLNVRLGAQSLEDYLTKFKTVQSVQHGVVMKEYLVVPDKVVASAKELKKWMDMSLRYANSLKPKKARS